MEEIEKKEIKEMTRIVWMKNKNSYIKNYDKGIRGVLVISGASAFSLIWSPATVV